MRLLCGNLMALLINNSIRTRRDHMKYLTLIRSITLLHQHQRPHKPPTHRGKAVEYIEVTRDDIRIANELTREVLGRSLDELPPQTRRLLLLIRRDGERRMRAAEERARGLSL
jgi:DNA-directed RNA polymerase specialized sigma24 family protein